MKLRVIGLEFRPFLAHETIEPEAVAVAFGVGEVRQDLGDGEAIGSRFPPRLLPGEFAHQPAQNLRRGFQLPDGRESVVFHLSILRCSPRQRHTFAGNAGEANYRGDPDRRLRAGYVLMSMEERPGKTVLVGRPANGATCWRDDHYRPRKVNEKGISVVAPFR